MYIPPDALEIFLEAFEGPLDLLLYLIRKQHFNVLDIPMAPLTLQYLTYIDQIRAKNLELAAEYLLMAALLIEIKSRMLLPVRKADSGEDAEDPRAELVRRLLEYERMKLAAQRLDELPRIGRDFLRAAVVIEQSLEKRFPQVNVIDLRDAWAHVVERARLIARHHINREELSVREHMSSILKALQQRKIRRVRGSVRPGARRCGRHRAFSGAAGTCARGADRYHSGGALCPDLHSFGLYTQLILMRGGTHDDLSFAVCFLVALRGTEAFAQMQAPTPPSGRVSHDARRRFIECVSRARRTGSWRKVVGPSRSR